MIWDSNNTDPIVLVMSEWAISLVWKSGIGYTQSARHTLMIIANYISILLASLPFDY